MSEGYIPIRRAIPIVVIVWILSLVTTLAIVYFSPLVPIVTDKIGDSAITSEKIAEGAVITTKLADGSVSSAKLVDGTIVAQDLSDGSIVSVKVADGAVTVTKIADNSIITAKIADSAILTVKLADGAVTSAKILDGSVTATDLATDAVTAIKITDGAVTTTKIADSAVTNLKLAGQAIPFNSTYSLPGASTNSTSYVDMPKMTVNIRLYRTSHLLIMMSSEFWISSSATGYIVVRALVNSTVALPPLTYVAGYSQTNAPTSSYSYVFYMPSVSAGFYTVKIQWKIDGAAGAEGTYGYRTLSVLALPT